jgi:SAM-dependent methyltransferase
MSNLWQGSHEASARFGAQALDYDRYRPRYPQTVFNDIIEIAGLSADSEVLEIGAGAGIATEPLVQRGLRVTAVEPAAEMAAVARNKVGERAHMFVGRFEDYARPDSVALVAAFNAWHWVEPHAAVGQVAGLLEPGGHLALVWTEVVSWGQQPFEDRLTEVFGHPWMKRMNFVDDSMQAIRDDDRFDDFQVRHHPFERNFDGASFVAVTRTYGGGRTDDQLKVIERIIDEEFAGSVTKTEDAVLYMARRN